MCDQWSDITFWWNILTPLEAQRCDKGGSKAARKQYQREYKKKAAMTDSSASSDRRRRVFTIHQRSLRLERFQVLYFCCMFLTGVSGGDWKLSFTVSAENHAWANVSFSRSCLNKYLVWCFLFRLCKWHALKQVVSCPTHHVHIKPTLRKQKFIFSNHWAHTYCTQKRSYWIYWNFKLGRFAFLN